MITDGKDIIETNMGSELVGLYYYALDKLKVNENNNINSKIFGYVPTIQNITFNPFIDMENDSLFKCIKSDFDSSHFGFNTSNGTPKVYRVKDFTPFSKKIGELNLRVYFENFDKEFESKLLQYPYKYFLLTDYINPPMLMKINQFKYVYENQDYNNPKLLFHVNLALSQSSKYVLYPQSYKNDYNGNIEGIVNNNPLQYPVGSSAYASFIATQGNSFMASNNLALLENEKSFSQNTQSLQYENDMNIYNSFNSGINGIVGLLSGNLVGGTMGVMNSVTGYYMNKRGNDLNSKFNTQNYQFKEYQVETMALAKKNDLLSTPRAIKSIGNDATFNIAHAKQRVDLIEYGLNSDYENRISNYFKRYGYKQNKYGYPNLKSRKYWNFIKFTKCNIDSAKIPSEHIEELQRIFESGVTLWHISNGAKVKQYYMDNVEV